MDTLALLCNLHADGPATLQRLRRIGCESLSALRHLDPTALAERLSWTERTAERFLREAALLSGRVESVEEAAGEFEAPEFEIESTLSEELEDDLEEGESEEEGEEPDDAAEEEEESSFAPPPERVQAVLGAWRELDRVAPPGDPDFVIPRPTPEAELDAGLLDSEFDWLSPALLTRMLELGIESLRALAGAGELELARALPLGFTRVKHLQFQAARELERLRTTAPRTAPPAAFGSFTPQPSEHETAGPFA